MESKRSRLGRQIGVFLCLAGLILEWVGWNGAASYDRISEQFPFLLSGGVAGLSLVVIGAALIVVQSQRSERATLEQHLAGLSRVLETLVEVSAAIRRPEGGEGFVLAATTAYHRPTCGLLEDHPRLRTVSVESAVEEGLLACRTCHPPVPAQPAATTPAAKPEDVGGGVGHVETAVKPDEDAGDVWFAPPDERETDVVDLAVVPGEDDDVGASAAAEPGEDAGEWTAGLPGPFPELADNPWDAGDAAEDEEDVVDLRSERELMTEAGALDLAGDPLSRRE